MEQTTKKKITESKSWFSVDICNIDSSGEIINIMEEKRGHHYRHYRHGEVITGHNFTTMWQCDNVDKETNLFKLPKHTQDKIYTPS